MKILLCAGLMLSISLASAQERRQTLAERALARISSAVNNQLKTPEAVLEEKIRNKEIDLRDLNQSFKHKGQSYKVSDFDRVIDNHVDELFLEMDPSEAEQFAQNYLVSKSELLNVKTQSPQRTDVLNTLNKMFGYIYADKGQEELAKILECEPEDKLTPIAEILGEIKTHEKNKNCEDLKPGESKIYEYSTSSGLPTNYLLNKKSDGSHQVVLSMNFVSQDKGSISSSDMFKRVKHCLASASGSLKGPKGEKLELTIIEPDQARGLKPVNIKIDNSLGYSTSQTYTENISCGTITHEVFHLLGLCDEYDENSQNRTSLRDKYNCRVVTKTPNIMNDVATFDQSVPQELTCECEEGACSKVMSSGKQSEIDFYLSRDLTSVMDLKFQNQYCKDANKYTFGNANWPEPSRSLLIKSEDNLTFTFYNRILTNNSGFAQTEIFCECPASDDLCLSKKKAILAALKTPGRRTSCPHYSKKLETRLSTNALDEYAFKNNRITFRTTPSMKNMITPAHFEKVIYGNCSTTRTSNYDKCASFASKSQPCDVPKECFDESYYIGVPK